MSTKSKKPSYIVLHAFPHAGAFYTRDNQDAVADLPSDVIQAHIDGGSIRKADAVEPEAAPPKETPAGKDR